MGGKKSKNDKAEHCDSFGNKITFKVIGGRTSAIVESLQSKEGGFRNFKNGKRMGKVTEMKEKLKRRNKHKLLFDQSNKKKRKLKIQNDDDEKDENEPKRKRKKMTKQKPMSQRLIF